MPPKVPPIKDPYCVSYAPTGRAACKKCSGLIAEGAIRFGRKVRSPWHDGFDIQWNHLRCGFDWVDDLEQVQGWQGLKWNDILKCAKKYGVSVDIDQPKVAEYRKHIDMVWAVQSSLEKTSMKVLKPVMDHNEMFYTHKTTAQEAASRVADGLIFGKLPPCPICEQNALIQEGPVMRCRGFVDGTTKCEFRYIFFDILHPDASPDNSAMGVDTSQLERVARITIPDQLKGSLVFKSLKLPTDAPSLALALPKQQSAKLKSEKEQASEDETLEDVPKWKELVGMKFASIGSTDPPKRELQELVLKHGGEFQDDVDTTTNYLLIGDDATGFKSLKRCQTAAELGVPILRVGFIAALISRTPVKPPKVAKRSKGEEAAKPQGIVLRQRKFAKFYKAGGPAGRFVPKVKDILASRAAAVSAAAAKEQEKILKRKRPPIAKESPLLQIDLWYPVRKNSSVKIYVDKCNNAYNCTVNLADISTGVNKFHSLQLIARKSSDANNESSQHVSNSSDENTRSKQTKRLKKRRKVEPQMRYCLFKKWGRVGAVESLKNDCTTVDYSTDLEGALAEFHLKFNQLTGKEWDDRYDTSAPPGRYRMVELMGHEEDSKTKQTPSNALVKVPQVLHAKCTLSDKLKSFMELIFDKKMMEKDLERQNLDLRKMPLGSISRRQMNEGYGILRELQTLLQEEEVNRTTIRWRSKLTAATSRFYTTVPHQFVLSQTPPVIDTLAKLRVKVELIEQLMDISIASTIMDGAMKNAQDKHPLEAIYLQLNCTLDVVPKDSEEFRRLEMAMRATHAETHNSFSVELVEIFRCDRSEERAKFAVDLDNRKLLWHGSRLPNWAGILAKGLRIAPEEAPVSGYMFDKGLYFADMASKCAQYCNATSCAPMGALVLSEVALGAAYLRLESDPKAAENCAKYGGSHTWGVGRMHPDPSGDEQLESDLDGLPVVLHGGRPLDNAANLALAKSSATAGKTQSLIYNEFVVYQERQVRMRYIFLVRFRFRSLLDDDEDEDESDSDDP